MINPESPPPPVEPEVKDARRTHCTHTLRRTTTPRQQRVHPHHRPLVGTTTCSRRQIGGPDHAGLWPSKPARPTTTAHLSPSWPVLPTQARSRLRIRARAILDCMCCDVPQSTPHTSAGNACRWARRCGLVMESLTHETADPSPSSTRTTTLCAPPASRIFDSIGFPLSVRQSITCSGNPASSIPTSLVVGDRPTMGWEQTAAHHHGQPSGAPNRPQSLRFGPWFLPAARFPPDHATGPYHHDGNPPTPPAVAYPTLTLLAPRAVACANLKPGLRFFVSQHISGPEATGQK